MPRIPYAEEEQVAAEAKAVYEQIRKGFGVVPNVVKLLGHSGPATQGLGTLLDVYFNRLSIPARVRETAYLTTARHNQCNYCQGHHVPLAKQAGLSDAQIELLDEKGLGNDALSPAEQAVVRFAWETSRDVVASDEALAALKEHFSNQEIAEIAFVVASANFIQRIGRNFGVELEG